MADRERLGDEAAERDAEHDRPLDLQGLAQGFQVIGPLVEVPALRAAAIAAAVAAVIDIDELGDVDKLGVLRFEVRMIEARPPVQQQQRRALRHFGSVRYEFRPLHIDEQPDIANIHAHPEPFRLPSPRADTSHLNLKCVA